MTNHSWTCRIPGVPVAKGRPRAAVINGRARLYTPKPTAEWESRAVAYLRDAWGGRDAIAGPVIALVEAVFERPQRLKTKRHATLTNVPHVCKPDGDNALKAAMDACEKAGIVVNDSQAWDSKIVKRYADAGEAPSVSVTVWWEAR